MTVIGLCGLAQSGKDTAAAHLVDVHGFRRIAFADQLRTALYNLDPYVTTRGGTYALTYLVDAHGWDQAKQLPDVRRLLQRFGTEVGRTLWGEDFWVERATAGITHGDRVVFTDVRFTNEAAAVRRLGGLVVEVTRPGRTTLDSRTAGHASEILDFDTDLVLVNDGTVADLHRQVAELLQGGWVSRPSGG